MQPSQLTSTSGGPSAPAALVVDPSSCSDSAMRSSSMVSETNVQLSPESDASQMHQQPRCSSSGPSPQTFTPCPSPASPFANPPPSSSLKSALRNAIGRLFRWSSANPSVAASNPTSSASSISTSSSASTNRKRNTTGSKGSVPEEISDETGAHRSGETMDTLRMLLANERARNEELERELKALEDQLKTARCTSCERLLQLAAGPLSSTPGSSDPNLVALAAAAAAGLPASAGSGSFAPPPAAALDPSTATIPATVPAVLSSCQLGPTLPPPMPKYEISRNILVIDQEGSRLVNVRDLPSRSNPIRGFGCIDARELKKEGVAAGASDPGSPSLRMPERTGCLSEALFSQSTVDQFDHLYPPSSLSRPGASTSPPSNSSSFSVANRGRQPSTDSTHGGTLPSSQRRRTYSLSTAERLRHPVIAPAQRILNFLRLHLTNNVENLVAVPEEYAQMLIDLCERAEGVLAADPIFLSLRSPIYVMGDIHGSAGDLSLFLTNLINFDHLCYTASQWLFLGDYVDRGVAGCEVAAMLLALKCVAPDAVFLLRGNHELAEVNQDTMRYRSSSFLSQCRLRFGRPLGDRVNQAFNAAFAQLPMAAEIDGRIFCVHGGIPNPSAGLNPPVPIAPNGAVGGSLGSFISEVGNSASTTNESVLDGPNTTASPPPLDFMPIMNLLRSNEMPRVQNWATYPQDTPEDRVWAALVAGLLWSDPAGADAVLDRTGFGPNPSRGERTHVFGQAALERFLSQTGYEYLIRAHEVQEEGLRLCLNGKVITVFSSSAYCGGANGAGALYMAQNKIRLISCSMLSRNDSRSNSPKVPKGTNPKPPSPDLARATYTTPPAVAKRSSMPPPTFTPTPNPFLTPSISANELSPSIATTNGPSEEDPRDSVAGMGSN